MTNFSESQGTAADAAISAAAVSGTSGAGVARRRYEDPSVLARLAQIRTMDIVALKAMWRDLFTTEPPPYNRKFLESRLSYRVQELAYGGLKPETLKRLAALAEDLDRESTSRRGAPEQKLLIGTRLLREWQGVEHTVTVLDRGYEWQGRPYQSLSSVARAITGTRWSGPLFFGLRRGPNA